MLRGVIGIARAGGRAATRAGGVIVAAVAAARIARGAHATVGVCGAVITAARAAFPGVAKAGTHVLVAVRVAVIDAVPATDVAAAEVIRCTVITAAQV